MKVLCIGNSFSDDAHTFVHEIAASVGQDITIGNLYIGGCPLERHWQNAQDDADEILQHARELEESGEVNPDTAEEIDEDLMELETEE